MSQPPILICPFFVAPNDELRDLLIEAIEAVTGLVPEGSRDMAHVRQAMYPLMPTKIFVASPTDDAVFDRFGEHTCAMGISVADTKQAVSAFKRVFHKHKIYVDDAPIEGYERDVYIALHIPVLRGIAIMLWTSGQPTDEALSVMQLWAGKQNNIRAA